MGLGARQLSSWAPWFVARCAARIIASNTVPAPRPTVKRSGASARRRWRLLRLVLPVPRLRWVLPAVPTVPRSSTRRRASLACAALIVQIPDPVILVSLCHVRPDNAAPRGCVESWRALAKRSSVSSWWGPHEVAVLRLRLIGRSLMRDLCRAKWPSCACFDRWHMQSPRCCGRAQNSNDPIFDGFPLKWGYASGQGKVCYYCKKVHEKRYATLKLKELCAQLKAKEEKDRFMGLVGTVEEKAGCLARLCFQSMPTQV
eukprot:6376107-Alexandrium_andersonii.AAC.1